MKNKNPRKEWVAPVIDIWEWTARQRHPAGKGLKAGETNSAQS
mgnify:CR=1 FL=1